MGIYPIRNANVSISRQQRFAKIAVELAGALDQDITHQLCALVVSKNRVLSVGYNQPKTHPISKDTTMQQLHAEMHAMIRCADKDLLGADVIVARTRPSGKPGLAKPCEVCEGILRRFGVRRVFYTVDCETPDSPELEEMKL
jgi:deoxycytidylate deaminase